MHAQKPVAQKSVAGMPPGLHAAAAAQSAEVLQPHMRPATHAGPGMPLLPWQLAQMPPDEPHAVAAVPGEQSGGLLATLQQPPLQGVSLAWLQTLVQL